MNAITKYYKLFLGISLFFLVSCAEEDKPFDSPFVYITDKYNGTSSTMDSKAKYTATYYVRLSSKAFDSDVAVNYELLPGDGLTKDVDYALVDSTASPLVFKKGIYEKVVQIKWLAHTLDKTKDNSLHIKLTSTNVENITIGKLGPDKIGSEYIITKQ